LAQGKAEALISEELPKCSNVRINIFYQESKMPHQLYRRTGEKFVKLLQTSNFNVTEKINAP
jgi:hypothetical protein